LEHNIKPFYDFILVDEAQDFPPEFFRVLANLVKSESRQIYFAYDELQSLTSLEIPRAEDLFGLDHNGEPFISLDGEYPGGIEKDFVLHKSYRCPRDILMLAHGIGLGIHGPKGCVQMLANRTSWESVGYEVKAGEFRTNDQMVIYRPEENSPNRIKDIYKGGKGIIEVGVFETRNEELDYVARSIRDDITVDNIRPEQILVISLDSRRAKEYLLGLQQRLYEGEIASTIPGLADGSWEFAELGRVTLSTVYRAKGNEAPVVYIVSVDVLYSYAEEIESRNRAFTSISRAKGWLRMSGIGKQMLSVRKEIDKLMQDIPYLKFQFPDMENIRIRRLDASETSRRRRQVSRARQGLETLLGIDSEALTDLDPKLLEKLKRRLDDLGDED
jgi:superfamily I DNA and RNA helicase